jgi:GDPmannose 4,6-dehydratase
LFNHESPLRPERFVTRKIVAAACRIAAGSGERLHLGDLSIRRDWGWAPEFVRAMWLMLQQDRPDDYVVATGRTFSLEDFAAQAFTLCGLQWEDHVEVDSSLYRPADIGIGRGDPSKAAVRLGWRARYSMPDVIRMMVEAERAVL